MENNDLVTRVVTSLDKHKADDIQVIQVTELTSLGDYFVIANGSSNRQVKSLADYVEYDLSQQGIQPLRVEGYSSASWILIDYGSVMVHVFREDTRQFYDLERLWKDGRQLDVQEFIADEE